MAQIETVSDMMRALEDEIESIKTGKITESAARVVSRFRGLQLKTAELNLQFLRLNRGKDGAKELKLIPGGKQHEAA